MRTPSRASGAHLRSLALAIVVLLLAVPAPAGCKPAGALGPATPAAGGDQTGEATASGSNAALRVTRDFGTTVMLDKQVPLSRPEPAVRILVRNAQVKTSYGGGFVEAIEGLSSGYSGGAGSKLDWFYYVNGVQASVGAAEYRVRKGDRVWWDYHDWSFAAAVPAVVGAYPEPFVHGHGGRVSPVVVVYAPALEPEAAAIRGALGKAGSKDASLNALTGSLDRPGEASLILVGPWEELARLGWIRDAAANAPVSGLFVRFEGGGARVLDTKGTAGPVLLGAGAVMATGQSGDPAVAWFVTGTDAAATRRAAVLVTERPEALAGAFGVVVDSGGRASAAPRPSGGTP